MQHWFRRSRLDPQGESRVILGCFVTCLIVCACAAIGFGWFAPPEHAELARGLRRTSLAILLTLIVFAALWTGVKRMLD
jgi:hypothetical protein